MSDLTVIVVGASAGGVEALTRLVAALPADLPAAVLMVLHISPGAPSVLPHILARATALHVCSAQNGDVIRAGTIYVAPADHHLVVEQRGRLVLARGPHEHGHRPALDALFRSAARVYGAGVLGAVLSGSLSDGTDGLAQVKAHGGVALAQAPEEARYPDMPRSAIAHVAVDHVQPVEALAATLVRLARARAADGTDDGGYAIDAPAPRHERTDALEAALWTAVTTLEESAELALRMAARAESAGCARSAELFGERARTLGRRAGTVREVIGLLPDGATTLPALEAP